MIGSASLSGALAQTLPEIERGRYSLSPIADGVVRLDTRTGAVSTCSDKGDGWACTIIPDERAAYDAEIGRLQSQKDALKAELAQRESSAAGKAGKTDEALPKQDSLKPKAEAERKIEIPLPSDRDIDRVMSFVENAWRKLVDIANRMQRDASGKI
ncbi:hypothetical protein [Tardiphaga sp.]|uniref:hypothetical protein n=1 Tax=Tardiphaga sp. TaxID=1926292 RepID=UPI002618E1A1|nr:hypothetical protein [Tardiphaga sp.]